MIITLSQEDLDRIRIETVEFEKATRVFYINLLAPAIAEVSGIAISILRKKLTDAEDQAPRFSIFQ